MNRFIDLSLASFLYLYSFSAQCLELFHEDKIMQAHALLMTINEAELSQYLDQDESLREKITSIKHVADKVILYRREATVSLSNSDMILD